MFRYSYNEHDLVDIYTLDKHRSILSNKYAKKSDLSNVIVLSINEAHKMNIPINSNCLEMECVKCSRMSLFIHNSATGFLCSVCNLHNNPIVLCVTCNNRLGCASCGGKCEEAYVNDKQGLVLCARDECLMPFGYCLPLNIICSCERDILKGITKMNLYPDLVDIIKKYITDPPDAWAYFTEKANLLADLTCTKADKCQLCQIDSKYEEVDIVSNTFVCKCDQILYVSDENLIEINEPCSDDEK